MLKKVFIKTFGCQMNERDSEILSQVLLDHGYREDGDMETADLVILNTCTIRAKAEQKVMSLLGALRKYKEHNPGMKICVAGCVAQQEGERLLQRMPHVDVVIGTQNIYEIAQILERVNTTGKPVIATGMARDFRIPAFLPQMHSSSAKETYSARSFKRFVTIMQGCDNYCAYCVVPYTRGREVSRNPDDIVEEIQILADQGIKEITLLGQNVNSYGMQSQSTPLPCSFPQLLHRIAEIEGIRRLRFTTSHPKDLSNELISCFGDIKVLCPQFHLPVQSGSDAVLQRMNRKYTIARYLERVEKLWSVRPDLALTTDMIVGFPGETDADFAMTMDLLEKVRFHGSFSFKYSDRPGVRSAGFSGKIPEKVKSERLAVYQRRQDEISLERNRTYLDTLLEVMVENTDGNNFQGRTGTNHIVHVEERTGLQPGEFAEVQIIHAGQHSLKGKLTSIGQL
jgi:tRNA-2-methylthio-N6-dimethylallyladenosine synthase